MNNQINSGLTSAFWTSSSGSSSSKYNCILNYLQLEYSFTWPMAIINTDMTMMNTMEKS
ncbi:hypothetical protein DERF_000075 [Dermatophagoides farinae]|uniref:Uncharacterized protein n=1 Tax=Dermatophagoides farinae TaxID=6954 RepID=A0A922I7W9_DERFA|nr:hypothetical protein DERF_000075 [Dermatophagoides farinae]